MYLQHLSLTNFRNYVRLELDLPPHVSVFQGANAQGKSNLLESICFLATIRFSRTVAERELINWEAAGEKLPFARLSANIQKAERKAQLEIILRPRSAMHHQGTLATIQKHIRVNGVARRAVDLIGQLNMVMFSPRDIDLIGGEPATRRRYLDITNSQVDPQYLRASQRYNKVLSQRNHLLRRIAACQSRPNELLFWDQELVKAGAYIILQRQRTIAELNDLANPMHDQLSGGQEKLTLQYRPSIDKEGLEMGALPEVEQAFNRVLGAARQRELARGLSLIGPHRDDLGFLVNEMDMGTYGSRGQQRTIALSLKLSEARFMLMRTGEWPVLLLDDVLSELDPERRQHLLEAISSYRQVLITTTDLDRFPSEFLARAEKFRIADGRIEPA
ncbi:MAG: DNA replication/repair protein RecF [Dehalococcoidia bacterium]|nr:DNA replication and repair protein RecF [Chloroflexota bacterium]MBT9161203.1 DNA replication and repair protein RecF [Chloroflexota bacterium]MBT9162897.1 DNA replication and repair protein RecF [Chloroflexota bacterium]